MAAELIVRPGTIDAGVIGRVLGTERAPAALHRPTRLVVDAHVATDHTLARIARTAGLPFLVDPQTYYLQDVQYVGQRWTQVPFGQPQALTPADLMPAGARERLVEDVLKFQLDAGATELIPPYVHIEAPSSGWIEVQARLWRTTRRILDRVGLRVPILCVAALGWRSLGPKSVPQLKALWDSLRILRPAEVALAASKVHMGTTAEHRLTDLLGLVKQLSQSYPVLMWQQGILGEACVAAGAIGYETGIGWRERCEFNQSMALYRSAPSPDGHPPARPVYMADLGRSVPKSTILEIQGRPQLFRRIICPDADCCAPGGASLVSDARRHAIVSRSRELAVLGRSTTSEWAWNYLADKAERGLYLATKINELAVTRVDTTALQAIHTIAMSRRTRRPGAGRRTA